MEYALMNQNVSLIGICRPLMGDPICCKKLLNSEIDILPAYENSLQYPFYISWLKYIFGIGNMMRQGGLQLWYYDSLIRLSQDKPVKHYLSFASTMDVNAHDSKKAKNLKNLNTVGLVTNAPSSSFSMKRIFALVIIIAYLFYKQSS